MTSPRNGTSAGKARRSRPQTRNGVLSRARWGRIVHFVASLFTVRWSLSFSVLFLVPAHLWAWTNGELSLWLDNDRGHALEPIIKKFESDSGIRVRVEAPEQITDSFAMAAQVAKGPDIVIWAHDKVGEWADAGLIAPIEVSSEFSRKFFPKAWQAVLHRGWIWGYPIGLETVTLIYNKNLLIGSPPADLAQ